MLSQRQLFLNHLAQTSSEPLAIEIIRAEGCEMFGPEGERYLDLISGISVSIIGHCHPDVVRAVREQSEKYMHLMVYGELIQAPQTRLAMELSSSLPGTLDCCYFVNSGSEAIEGAMKLAKRATGRSGIVSFNKAYHGSTQGALSIIGDEYFRNAFRPLLPGITRLDYGNFDQLEEIGSHTAAVVIEAIQGEAGAVVPPSGYLKAVEARCRLSGALLIVDEIQSGFGRTGPFMAFMEEGIMPDILVLAKGMGGGMPIGAFIASRELMGQLSSNPVLGHITTFGGHPVSCAASLAALKVVQQISPEETVRKGKLFREKLVHPKIKGITGKGLMLGVDFGSEAFNRELISRCIAKGVFTDWFLFAPHKMRIAPPLIISDHQIFMACDAILQCIEEMP